MGGEEEVGWLQVPVQHTALVEEPQPLQELEEEALDVLLGEEALAPVDHLIVRLGVESFRYACSRIF